MPAIGTRAHTAHPDGLDELARAARRGESGAFDQLVTETAPQIYALALRLVGDEHDAGDLVQETYLRAYRSIGRFRSDAAVTTWLHRIAANCAASHLRRRRPALPIEAADALVDDTLDADPERMADGAVERRRLRAALLELPEALRAVVVLHDVYDLGHDVIAAELGISRGAAKVRLHRARRRLRELLFPERRGSATPESNAAVRPLAQRRGAESSDDGEGRRVAAR